VVPDLSKMQGEDEFLLLHFVEIFLTFFKKKLWLMSNIQSKK